MTNPYSSLEYILINGKKQCLSIRSTKEHLPILLYLHGGPGDAALPLVAKYNRALENYFTIVVWEQRGAGKSYYPFENEKNITIATFLEDLYEISTILLTKFHQSKLYLVGHSWGSVLGLKFIQLHPELVHTYIGCGQVVNMKKSSRLACDYVIAKSKEAGDLKVRNRLKRIDCTYSSAGWLDDLLFVTRQVVKYKGSLYGKKSYTPFVSSFLFSPHYKLKDLLNRQKGALQSITYLWQELMTINFEDVTALSVPIALIEGRFDYHVSSDLAKEYFNTIVTQKQFFWFEHSCHFPQWSEPEKFTDIMRSLIIK